MVGNKHLHSPISHYIPFRVVRSNLKTRPLHDTFQPFPMSESTLMQLLLEPPFLSKQFPQMLIIHRKAFCLQIQQHKRQHLHLANSTPCYFAPSLCVVRTLSLAGLLRRPHRNLHLCLQTVLPRFVNVTTRNLGIESRPSRFYSQRRRLWEQWD